MIPTLNLRPALAFGQQLTGVNCAQARMAAPVTPAAPGDRFERTAPQAAPTQFGFFSFQKKLDPALQALDRALANQRNGFITVINAGPVY